MPNAVPKIAQLSWRWRDGSSSTEISPRGVEGVAASSADPVVGEVSDTDLDLVELDIAEAARRNDFQTIYHDVGDRARRERVDHILFQGLRRPQRRVVHVESDQVAAKSGGNAPDGQPQDLGRGLGAEGETRLGVDRLAIGPVNFLQQRG